MADERVIFEVHADDSTLEAEMTRAGRTVTKSAEQTAESQKKKQKEVTDVVKQSASEQSGAVETSQKKIGSIFMETNSKIVSDTVNMNRRRVQDTSDAGDKIVRKHKQDSDELKKHVEEYEEKAKKTADNVKKAYIAIGTAAVTSSIAAMTEAAKAETSFAKVKTLLSDKIVTDDYYASMKAASKDTGLSFADLSESVYSAISASVDESKAVDFAKTANKLAKGGFTQASTAVDVLTTAINAYSKTAEDATHISDVLITTQNAGKTTVDELAASMGQTIPIAKGANASIEDLSTQYAVLTKNGVQTAIAGTQIKAMLGELSKSGSTASDAIKDLTGKSFAELQSEGKSTADILLILDDHAKSSGKSISDMFGSMEAGAAAMTLIKDGGSDFNKILSQMENSADATEKAYNTMADTMEAKVEKLKNKFIIAFTEVGEELMPYAEDLANYVDDHSEEIADMIRDIGAAAGELTKALAEGIKFLWEHKEAVIAVVTAYAALKTAIAIGSAVNTTADAISKINRMMNAAPAAASSMSGKITGAFGKIGAAASSALGMITIGATEAAVFIKGIYEECFKLDDAVQKLVGSADGLKSTISDTVAASEAENDIIRTKADEYEKLRSKIELTAEEKDRLKALSEDLQKTFGDEINVIDEVTGKYNDLSGSLENYLEKKTKREELDAKENAAKEAKKRLAEIERAKKDVTDNFQDTSLGNLGFFGYLDEVFAHGAGREHKWLNEMEALRNEEAELQGIVDDWKSSYEDFYGVIDNTTDAVDSNFKALEKSAAQLAANATAASDAATSYEDLAKSTEDIIKQNQSLYDILDKVKNGEALTYDEIQKMIAICPDLADKINLTADGYSLEKTALDDLNTALGNSVQAQIDAEREKTLAAISGARERIAVYQSEIEAQARQGKYADQKVIQEKKEAIRSQLDYINGLEAKLKTDSSLAEYMQNSAAGSSRTNGSSDTTAEEKAYEEGLERLNHRKAMGEFDGKEDEYWKEYRTLAEMLPENNKKRWAAEEALHSYEESKNLKPEEKFSNALKDLDYRHNMDKIADENYWKERTSLRDTYLEKDSDKYRDEEVSQYQWEQSRLKKDSSGQGSRNGGNVISIDSYVPTIWDDTAAAKKKLRDGSKIEHALRSIDGKTASDIGGIEAPQTEPSAKAAVSAAKENTLADVIRAIEDLKKSDVERKISLYAELKARDLVIGTVAAADINDITKRDGKSPLNQ